VTGPKLRVRVDRAAASNDVDDDREDDAWWGEDRVGVKVHDGVRSPWADSPAPGLPVSSGASISGPVEVVGSADVDADVDVDDDVDDDAQSDADRRELGSKVALGRAAGGDNDDDSDDGSFYSARLLCSDAETEIL
jgi:hypothetical protein